MKTLCMDSSHKYLVLGLYEDNQLIAGYAKESWKNQSEMIFPQLIALCEQAGWKSDDIDEVVITDGPGSYTGVRIAMSIAKVLCTRKHIPLYVLSSLQLLVGSHAHALAVMDARSNRAYCARYSEGKLIGKEEILTLEELKQIQKDHQFAVYGDADLIDCQAAKTDFLLNFLELRPFAREVKNMHTLVPRYLKEQDAYKVK